MRAMTGSVDTATSALRRAVYYLDRSLAPAPKVRAFRTALSVIEGLGDDELDRHLAAKSLTELDGIGPATAQNILEFREANGGFGSVEELGEVPGIGEVRLASLREQVRV